MGQVIALLVGIFAIVLIVKHLKDVDKTLKEKQK